MPAPNPLTAMLPPAALTMPLAKVLTFQTLMPTPAAVIAPELLMPPEKVETPWTKMPLRAPELMVPALVMPPAKLETIYTLAEAALELEPTWMPIPPARIVPPAALTMPPENAVTAPTARPKPPAETVPELLMPP